MRDDLDVGAGFLGPYDKAVGRLENAVGLISLIRGGHASPASGLGELVYEGDVIEVGADGSAVVRLIDGTTFHLSPDSCIIIEAYDPAEGSAGPSSVRVVRGEVGFFPGRKVRDGRLSVETPSVAIRGTGVALGVSALATLFFLCLVKEAGAASEVIEILDFDDVTFRDLHHGTFEVITKGQNPQVFIVDDPGRTLVLHPRGSGFSIEIVANTRAQMLDLQNAYKSAYDIFSSGAQDPFFQLLQRTANAVGSGGTIDMDAFRSGKFAALFNLGLQSDLVVLPVVYRNSDQKSGDSGPSSTLITIPATVHVLPISRFQIGEVNFSPNISISFPPTYEKLISVTFQHVPAGYIIKDGNGNQYSGPSFTILATDYYSGLTLITPASGVTEAYLEVSATVDGLGGPVESHPVRMPLTLDQDPTDKVKWTGNTGLWETDANWSTGVKPLPTQDVVIGASTTGGVVDVTSTKDVSLNSLRVDAGTTLEIAGGHFAINAADNDPFSNEGTVKIENSSASFTVGNAQHPGQLIVNSGTIEAIYGLIVFISANVANDTGRIQIDAPSSLNLQDTTIDSGELVNHGLVKVSNGASNSIHDLTIGGFLNDGELLITGSGTTLLLSHETLNNVGGLVTVDPGAILNLSAMTITGGTLSGTGEINVIGDITLDGSSGHTVTIDSGTAVTVHTGTTLTLEGSIQGGGEISVAGASAIVANGDVDVPINAAALADGALLTLSGTSDLTVTNLKGDLTATNLSGDLDVTTSDVADLNIKTGSGANTIDATALASGHVLDLKGDDDASVSLGDGDLDAHTDSGALTVEVVTNGAASTNTITIGSNDIQVTGDEAADDITIDATALADGNTLTLDGLAAFTVTHLKGDLDATNLSGDLDVTTADVADLSIKTGSGANTIDATALTSGHVLDLKGDDDTSVSLGDGDLDAHTDSGTLTVEVATNGVASTNTITTGSNDIRVTGDETQDDITVDATALADGDTLTLDGLAAFTVTHLKGDLDATNLSGDLDATTTDVADLSIKTGSGANTIDATALASGHVLDLKGDDDASVSLGDGDLDAHTDSGALTVEVVTNGAASTNTITTGTSDIHVTGDEAADDITVDATALADGNTLTLDGQAEFTVTHLQGDLDATNLLGDLDVTTADVADLSIKTGSGANTIDATALANGHILDLKGDDDASVSLTDGDLDAHTDSGVLTVEVVTNGAASSNTITTGSNDIQVTGDEAADSILVDATALADGNTLTLDGQAQFTVTHLQGDLDAAGLSGDLDVTTADVADLTIKTGSGANTIDATALASGHVLNLKGDDDASVSLADGDLDAHTDDGVLTVEVLANGAASTNTITTGSNDIQVTGDEAADSITVDATALADGNALTLDGQAQFTVTHLQGDLDASGLSGDLDVTTADVADLTIKTGSGADTIDATALASGHILNLTGNDDASVSLSDGDLDAHTDTGALTVEIVTNGAASSNTITTGSNDTHVTGDEAADSITVDATALADGNTLTLDGQAQFTVTHLKGDLDADSLSGDLDVTTADIADLTIKTGSGANTIDATALASGHLLNLKGNDDASVSLKDGDLDAHTDTGVLTVEVVANGSASSDTITTGSNDIHVTGDEAADNITVDATALADGNTLTLDGQAQFTVTHLKGDLDADSLSGDLDVTTADIADLSIKTGSGANTIDATALASGHVLDLKGDDDASVSLRDGDLDAHTDTGVLTVEIVANGAASSNTITTGSNDTHVTGDEAADRILVDVTAFADGNTLTLEGQAQFIVTHLQGDLDATNLLGDLDVTTADVADLSIKTGSGANTIDATALASGHILNLTGNDDTSVSLSDGDLDAHTDTGTLTVEIVTNGAASSNTITTGSNDIHVTGDEATDNIAVDATVLADGNTLTLDGQAQFTVTHLQGDLDASSLSGDLDVTTADVGDLGIKAGSGANTIDATALASGHLLNLKGDDDASVSLTDGDLDAHTDTGVLTVEVVANGAASSNTITTGSNDTHVTGDEAADNIAVDAAALADGNTLTLDGQAQFTVTYLQGDLDATNLSGDLDVTTTDVADLTIKTGSGVNTIDATALADNHLLKLRGHDAAAVSLTDGNLSATTDTGVLTVEVLANGAASTNTIVTGTNDIHVTGDEAQDAIRVNAASLADDNTLTLDGLARFTVTHLQGDLDAAGLIGKLDVTTTDIAGAGTIDITTGSNDTRITAGALLPGGTPDDITVDATALADGNILTLAGPADFTVDHLAGDLDADGLSGDIDVTTADVANLRITTGSGANTIDATALADSHVLRLRGDDDASVSLTDGNLNATTDTGVLSVEIVANGAASSNIITTGSNDIHIAGDELGDTVRVNAASLVSGKTLTLDGQADFIVKNLGADLDATNLSGGLLVAVSDVANLSITTGSYINIIDATALTANHVLELKGNDDAVVGFTDGSLNAATDTGYLFVEVVANGAASSNTIITGQNDIEIVGDEAADNIAVDATNLADGNLLMVDGLAAFTVTHLQADLDATYLFGDLEVTTADVAVLRIATGAGANTIDATALADNHVLKLFGVDDASVSLTDGNLNAATDDGVLSVEIVANGAASSNHITTGSNDIHVTGDEAADTIRVNAANLASNNVLTLDGQADFIVKNLGAKLDATSLSGDLDVTTADAAIVRVETGSGTNTIDATALTDNHVLKLFGDDDASVSLTDGNLNAATDTGAISVEVVSNGTASSNNIVTGSNDIHITGDEAADTVRVNTASLADDNTLTLDGLARFTVTNLEGDLDAAGLSGKLDVTTTDIAGAGTIDITTGSNDTRITAGTLLPGGTPDDIIVHAAALTDGKTLTLAGPADFTVDHLASDLDADGLSGDLDVTTVDVADLRITTGSCTNAINTEALTDNHVLKLFGDDDASVSLTDGNLNAATDTGAISAEVVANGTASSNNIVTGSNDIHITGDELGDTVRVNAASLVSGNTLTLDGQADFIVNNLGADLDATSLQGKLKVTGTSASNIIVGGAGNDTLDGLGGGDTLTGGQGHDKFVFAASEGANTVTDFSIGQDHIVLSGIFTSTSDAAFQAFLSGLQSQASGVHDIDIAGTTIVLHNVDVNQLHQSDFVVQ